MAGGVAWTSVSVLRSDVEGLEGDSMATVIRRVGEVVIGYIIGAVALAATIFWLVVEAQAREDEANEREMLMRRDWEQGL